MKDTVQNISDLFTKYGIGPVDENGVNQAPLLAGKMVEAGFTFSPGANKKKIAVISQDEAWVQAITREFYREQNNRIGMIADFLHYATRTDNVAKLSEGEKYSRVRSIVTLAHCLYFEGVCPPQKSKPSRVISLVA